MKENTLLSQFASSFRSQGKVMNELSTQGDLLGWFARGCLFYNWSWCWRWSRCETSKKKQEKKKRRGKEIKN